MRIFYSLYTKISPQITKDLIKGPATTMSKKIFNALFGKYLLATNIASSGILMFIGDYVSQQIENKYQKQNKQIDYQRLGQMFLVGSLSGPIHHYFYKWIDHILPKADVTTVTKKILLDQFIMSPVCIVTFFYSSGLLEKKSLQECQHELKSKFLTIYTTDWCVWPATQFINFYFLAPKYRVLYVNVLTMLYNVFLSYIKHLEIEAPSLAKKL